MCIRDRGRADLYFSVGLIKKLVGVVVLFYTIQFDIETVIIGQIVVSKLNYFPNAYYSKQLINYGIREQLIDFIPALLISAGVSATVYYLQLQLSYSAILELISFIVFSIFLYLSISYIFKIKGLEDTIELIFRR